MYSTIQLSQYFTFVTQVLLSLLKMSYIFKNISIFKLSAEKSWMGGTPPPPMLRLFYHNIASIHLYGGVFFWGGGVNLLNFNPFENKDITMDKISNSASQVIGFVLKHYIHLFSYSRKRTRSQKAFASTINHHGLLPV